MSKKANTSNIEVRAKTIGFVTDGMTIETTIFDFEEVRKTELGKPEVIVELDAWIPADQAIRALKMIIAHIEAGGLPSPIMLLTRKSAQDLFELEDIANKISSYVLGTRRDGRKRYAAFLAHNFNSFHGGNRE